MKHPVSVQLHVARVIGLAILSLFAAASAWAGQTNQGTVYTEVKAIRTEAIRGFCVGLNGRPSDDFTNNTTTESVLSFVPWTTSSSAWIVVPVEAEYAYQVDMFDTNGVAIPKKELGKKVGSKFFDFDASGSQKGIATRHLFVRKIGEVTGSLSLFRPEDLFQIEKLGKYTLRIRFQILTFPRTGPGHKNYTNDLIRFPAIDYPLIKPDTLRKKP
jgi:hypothetical protein